MVQPCSTMKTPCHCMLILYGVQNNSISLKQFFFSLCMNFLSLLITFVWPFCTKLLMSFKKKKKKMYWVQKRQCTCLYHIFSENNENSVNGFFVSDYYYSGLVRWKACALLDSCASLAVQSSPLRLPFCSTETSVSGEHSVLDRVLLVRYWSSYKPIHESRVQSLDIYIKWLRICFIWYEIHTVAVQGVFTPVPVFGQAFIALKAQRNLYLVLPTL